LPCLFQTRGYSFYLHVYFRQGGDSGWEGSMCKVSLPGREWNCDTACSKLYTREAGGPGLLLAGLIRGFLQS